jgi:hypothetical protein
MAPPTHAEYMFKFSGMYSGGCSKREIIHHNMFKFSSVVLILNSQKLNNIQL